MKEVPLGRGFEQFVQLCIQFSGLHVHLFADAAFNGGADTEYRDHILA